jgi:hypothetical protein
MFISYIQTFVNLAVQLCSTLDYLTFHYLVRSVIHPSVILPWVTVVQFFRLSVISRSIILPLVVRY